MVRNADDALQPFSSQAQLDAGKVQPESHDRGT